MPALLMDFSFLPTSNPAPDVRTTAKPQIHAPRKVTQAIVVYPPSTEAVVSTNAIVKSPVGPLPQGARVVPDASTLVRLETLAIAVVTLSTGACTSLECAVSTSANARSQGGWFLPVHSLAKNVLIPVRRGIHVVVLWIRTTNAPLSTREAHICALLIRVNVAGREFCLLGTPNRAPGVRRRVPLAIPVALEETLATSAFTLREKRAESLLVYVMP